MVMTDDNYTLGAACLPLETNLLVQLVGAPSCFGLLRSPVFSGSAEPEN